MCQLSSFVRDGFSIVKSTYLNVMSTGGFLLKLIIHR